MSDRLAMVLPCIMCGLPVLASGGYLYTGDMRRSLYWIAAAVITASVTF